MIAACVWADDGPILTDGEKVKVYEAGPVDAERERMLDLLEGAFNAYMADAEIGTLLESHGRLTGSSPSAPVDD